MVPQTLNLVHGVVVLENLRLADLSAAGLRSSCSSLPIPNFGAPTPRGSLRSQSSEKERLMSEHFDGIVIGSGAGGGTLTHALTPTGKRILLLERGGFLPPERQNWDPQSI